MAGWAPPLGPPNGARPSGFNRQADQRVGMTTRNRCHLLVDKIRDIFGEGVFLSEDVLHYIDSTFSQPTIKKLEHILADEDDSERDSLLELLFFPDEPFQARLEDILEAHAFDRKDVRVIGVLLSRPPVETFFRFPGGKKAIHSAMPAIGAENFVSRLHITKRIPLRLTRAIERHYPAATGAWIKVKLRNSRFSATERRIFFLSSFFSKTNGQDPHFPLCLGTAIQLLDELETDRDVYQALVAKKKFYFKGLQAAAGFERKLARNNMETLMMQGFRCPTVSPGEARQQMLVIDKLCQAVFAKSVYFRPDQPSVVTHF